MKRINVNGYVSPVMEFLTLHNENILCASTGTMGSSNEAISGEEQFTGDIILGW